MKSFALPLAVAMIVSAAAAAGAATDKDKKPTLSVKSSPSVAFSPARVVVTADLRGGADDDQEFYCAAVEWDWGDGTKSNASADCDPYVAGQSEIKRHFTADRIFRTAGDYRVSLTLRKKDKVIAVGSTFVKIRPGIRDAGGGH